MKFLWCLALACAGSPAQAQTWWPAVTPGTSWILQHPSTPKTNYQIRATDWSADHGRLLVRVTPITLTSEPALGQHATNGYMYTQAGVLWLIFEEDTTRYGCGVALPATVPPIYPAGLVGRSVQQSAQGTVSLPSPCTLSRQHRNVFLKLTGLPQPGLRQVWNLGLNGLIQARYNVIWGSLAADGLATTGVAYDVDTSTPYRAEYRKLPDQGGMVLSVQLGTQTLYCVSTENDASPSGAEYGGTIFHVPEGQSEPVTTLQDCDVSVSSP